MEWTINMASNIHWYPGHMKKATIKIEERIKAVDLVIELLDARAPLSSINNDFEKIVGNKKRLFVFTKADLADKEQTSKWKEYFLERQEATNENLLLTTSDTSNSGARSWTNCCTCRREAGTSRAPCGG